MANCNSRKDNCCEVNESIKCTVQQCEYHCGNDNYCSLPNIRVGTHEMNPTESQCTDCESFKLKS